MLRIALAIIVLLLGISYGYADDFPTEEVERQAKKHQMEQIADRFKAETGFRGEINYDYTRMKLQLFEGKFADIPFSADADTTAFRKACERILDKLLPYSLAKRSQLPMKRITRNGNYTETIYDQTVNGYRVENTGFIIIAYDAGRNRFDIGDITVELPDENITPVLTFEDAVKIYDENVKDDEVTKKLRKRRPFLSLCFSNIYNEWEGDTRREYRLCWVGGEKRIYIDSITGQVYKIVDMKMDD